MLKVILFFFIIINKLKSEKLEYNNNNPSYIVGIPIEINKPNINENGNWIIYPEFSTGLYFNEKNGYIEGTPIEEYQGSYVVYFTNIYNQSLTCLLRIKSIFFIYKNFNSMGTSTFVLL